MSTTCRCISLADSLRYRLEGREVPTCEEHDPKPTSDTVLPLGSDALHNALAQQLGATSASSTDI